MGNGIRKTVPTDNSNATDAITKYQADFRTVAIPLSVKVAHYTPASFPLLPHISKDTCKHIADSWDVITKSDVVSSSGISTAGITAFYSK
jgi:hypothetical protein